MSREENGYPQRTGYLPCLPPRPATGPRGLAALGAAALSTGLLTATTAPAAGGVASFIIYLLNRQLRAST
jgi:hypothetical protein